jgi:hypothetical protein
MSHFETETFSTYTKTFIKNNNSILYFNLKWDMGSKKWDMGSKKWDMGYSECPTLKQRHFPLIQRPVSHHTKNRQIICTGRFQ